MAQSDFAARFPILAEALSEALSEGETNCDTEALDMLGVILADCSRFAILRSAGMYYRKRGEIAKAIGFENTADEIYKGLPPEIRW